MIRRRRAAVLLGLALLLGGLAASDVAGREAALRRAVGPTVPVVVVRSRLAAGDVIDARHLAVRRVPARFAPAMAYGSMTRARRHPGGRRAGGRGGRRAVLGRRWHRARRARRCVSVSGWPSSWLVAPLG